MKPPVLPTSLPEALSRLQEGTRAAPMDWDAVRLLVDAEGLTERRAAKAIGALALAYERRWYDEYNPSRSTLLGRVGEALRAAAEQERTRSLMREYRHARRLAKEYRTPGNGQCVNWQAYAAMVGVMAVLAGVLSGTGRSTP